MSVADLIEYLSNFDPETEVMMTYFCDNAYRPLDALKEDPVNHRVIMESYETPNFDDLQVIADSVFDEHGDNMSQKEKKIMTDFIQ